MIKITFKTAPDYHNSEPARAVVVPSNFPSRNRQKPRKSQLKSSDGGEEKDATRGTKAADWRMLIPLNCRELVSHLDPTTLHRIGDGDAL